MAAAEPSDEPANSTIFEQERRAYENPEAAPVRPSVATPAAIESVESLAARVHAARQLAAEQRRAAEAVLPATAGLSRAELEVRAAEQNLSTYDLQIFRGEGTAAIEAFRSLTIRTLGDARRKGLLVAWGDGVYHPEAFDVLSDYGRSMAELRRIRFLAKAKGLTPLVQRSDELMLQASSTFERDMRRLSDEVRDNPSFARLSRELHPKTPAEPR